MINSLQIQLTEQNDFEVSFWLQIAVTIFVALTLYIKNYNDISDPIERETKKPYAIKEYLKLTWANGLQMLFSGIILLLVLNEGGLPLLKNFFEIPDIVEDIGKLTIAVLSGLFGQRLIEKLSISK